MAPPRKGAAAAEQAKERLTALVMADSFTQRFRPVTAERPKVLLPLVNVPMLDYTLEWLAMNGVEEVFVFCCAHAEAIQAHLAAAGWAKSRRMALHVVVSTNCLSLGDALRLMDHKDAIKTDFVLVSGDVVTNMRLAPAVEAHRRRRAADKSAIMTLVMRSGMTPAHRLRLGQGGITVAIDPTTSRLLKYEEIPGPGASSNAPKRAKGMRLDAAFFSERDDVILRSDLVDTGVYVCAPEVLMLFSDNFDYQNVRRDFVSGVLSEEELGNKLFVQEVSQQYAARVRSMRSYDAVSRDVMARWAYPLVPDTNLFCGDRGTGGGSAAAAASAPPTSHAAASSPPGVPPPRRSRYRYTRGMVYLDDGAVLDRAARVTSGSAVGAGTYVAAGATLEATVVGRGCTIGAGAVLRGCYLGDGVIIGADATATSAMLCDGVVVKDGATIEPNVVLSYRVVVDRRAVVPAGARVSLVTPPAGGGAGGSDSDEDDGETMGAGGGGGGFGFARSSGGFGSSDDDSDEDGEGGSGAAGPTAEVLAAAAALAADGIPEAAIQFSTEVVGAMGAGFAWPVPPGEATPLLGLEPPLAALEAAARGELGPEPEEEEFAAGGEEGGPGGDADGDAAAAAAATAAAAAEPHFKREVAETFLRCVKEGISHENVVIELNGLKIAEDKTFADCARFMLTTALGLCLPAPLSASKEYRGLYRAEEVDVSSTDGRVELLRRAAAQLRRWTDLLHKFLKNEEDQVELLLTLEEFCGEEGDFEGTGERGAAYAAIFPQMLKLLYELDVAGEEAILAWAEEKEHADEEEKRFLTLAQPFLEWLEDAEEESEEESEEDEEESSEEE